MTVQEAAELIGCKKAAVKVYVRELFPGRSLPDLDGDVIRQKQKELYGELVRLIQSGRCSTHGLIAARLGISAKLLAALLGGRIFVERAFPEEEDEAPVCWPRLGISMKRPGRLEIVPRKETAKPGGGALLSYQPGASPLEAGLRGTGGTG
jgi:hypothetical protein